MVEEAAGIEADLQAAQRENDPVPYLHRRRIPLLDAVRADLDDAEAQPELDLWGEECEGVCGV